MVWTRAVAGGDSKKCLDSGSILKVELIRFLAKLDKGREREREFIKDNAKVFILIIRNKENMANRKKRIEDSKYKQLFQGVLVKREAKKRSAHHRRNGGRRT